MNNLREGERRYVTVLFSDMKGFTSLSEKMDPEEMDALMDEVFSAFESVVLRFDGVVEKYIGDALVAVFGAPSIHEDDPARAVNAALDFQSELRHLNRMLRRRDVEVTFRTGINTGLVTTGKRGQFEVVTGHTMSVASRLEAAAPPAGVLVSESTKEKCESEFLFSESIAVKPRGADEAVTAYTVLGRNTDPFHRDQIFVDRADHLSRMTKRYLRHDPSATDGFYVLGPAGIGKTALVTKFIERIRTYPDFNSAVLHAKARPYRRTSFSVIRDLIVNYLNIENTRDTEALRQRLVERLEVEDRSAREFAALLSGAHASHIDNQAFILLYAVLKHVLKKHEPSPYPVLIFIDNASFIERQSRDFFQFFLKNADIKPFFIFTDRRADEVIGDLFRECERIVVDPLAPEDAAEYLERLRPDLSDEDVKQVIQNRARGNPLFIREYARSAGPGTTVPTTIQNILLTSIDSYSHAYRDLLKKLSVFFVSFSKDDAIFLQERTDGDPSIISDAVSLFIRDGLIVEEEGIYAFSHDLLKQALYNSILNYNKRILHRLIAERMQQGEHPHTFRLLDHLFRAEEFATAREILEAVPDLPINPDYLPYLDTLIEQTDESDTANTILYLFMRSAILFNNGLTEQSDTALKEILAIALRSRESAYLARAFHILCAFNMKSYSFHKASFCGRKAIEYYRESTQSPSRFQNMQNILGIVSLSEALRNNVTEAKRCLEEAAKLESVNELGLVNNWAELYLLLGRYAEAAEALAPYEQVDDRDSVAGHWLSSSFLRILALWHMCEFEPLKGAVRILQDHEPRNYANLSQVYAYLAVACRMTGEGAKTAGYLQQAEFLSLQTNSDFDRVDTLRTLAESRLILERYDEAQAAAEEGVAMALQNTAYYPGFTLLLILVELADHRGNESEARFFLREATFLLESRTALRNRDQMLYHYFAAKLGVDDHAEEHRRAARALMDQERENVGGEERFRRLMALRCFPEISHALAESIQRS